MTKVITILMTDEPFSKEVIEVILPKERPELKVLPILVDENISPKKLEEMISLIKGII